MKEYVWQGAFGCLVGCNHDCHPLCQAHCFTETPLPLKCTKKHEAAHIDDYRMKDARSRLQKGSAEALGMVDADSDVS